MSLIKRYIGDLKFYLAELRQPGFLWAIQIFFFLAHITSYFCFLYLTVYAWYVMIIIRLVWILSIAVLLVILFLKNRYLLYVSHFLAPVVLIIMTGYLPIIGNKNQVYVQLSTVNSPYINDGDIVLVSHDLPSLKVLDFAVMRRKLPSYLLSVVIGLPGHTFVHKNGTTKICNTKICFMCNADHSLVRAPRTAGDNGSVRNSYVLVYAKKKRCFEEHLKRTFTVEQYIGTVKAIALSGDTINKQIETSGLVSNAER